MYSERVVTILDYFQIGRAIVEASKLITRVEDVTQKESQHYLYNDKGNEGRDESKREIFNQVQTPLASCLCLQSLAVYFCVGYSCQSQVYPFLYA